MDSLYGGHSGVSFVLKASFKSVREMEQAFREGASYRDVWYGEYCLIDTPNKNHKDNGKIYQRDVPKTNNDSGAKYIGQIVGPSSGTPYFQTLGIDEVAEQVADKTFDDEGEETTSYLRFPVGWDADKKKYVTSNDKSKLDSLYKRQFTAADQTLVPGKDGDTYNDGIEYTWLNVREDDDDADSWFYVGFKFPYLVNEFSATSISPYASDGSIAANRNASAMRTDDKSHPYYAKWDFKVPHGIKGDTIRNLHVVGLQKASDSSNPLGFGYDLYNASSIYLPNAITKNADGTTSVSSDASKKLSSVYTDDAISNKHANYPLVLVLDYYVYDESQNPTSYMIYVGDYDMIDEVSVLDDGTVSVKYTNSAKYERTKLIKWVKSTSLDDNGNFVMSFNNGSADYKTQLEWVKDITLSDTGVVHLTKTKNGHDLTQKLTWVKSVSFDENTGNLSFTFNNNDTVANVAKTLVWVKNLTVADNGDVSITKTDGKSQDGTTTKIANIKWVDSVSLADDGSLTFNFNNGTKTTFDGAIEYVVSETVSGDGVITQTLNTKTNGVANTRTVNGVSGNSNTDSSGTFHLKAVSGISVNNSSVDSSGKLLVTYNWDKSGKTTQEVGNSLNFVSDVVVRGADYPGTPKDWHLLVLYSAPDKRPTNGGTSNTQVLTTGDLQGTWVKGVYGSQGTLDSTHWWKDFGCVKDDSGLLIGVNVNPDETSATTNAAIISELNTKYPNGLGVDADGNATDDSPLTGKIVVYTRGSTRKLFAFDYSRNASGAYRKWFYLGGVGDSGDGGGGASSGAVLAPETNYADAADGVGDNGLVFTYESVASASAYPSYWSSSYTN